MHSALARDEGVKFSMRNLCGEAVRVYWIGFDGELVPQSALPVKNSSGISINSYQSHKFAIWYSRASEEQTKTEALIRGTRYTVGDTNDIVTIEEGLVLYRHDAWHVAHEATRYSIQFCDTAYVFRNIFGTVVADKTSSNNKIHHGAVGGSAVVFDHDKCVRENLKSWLNERRGELDFEWEIYSVLKGGLSAYGCAESKNDALYTKNSQIELVTEVSSDERVMARGLLDAVQASIKAKANSSAWADVEGYGANAPVCHDMAQLFEIDGSIKSIEQIMTDGEDELGQVLSGRVGAAPRKPVESVIRKAMESCEYLRDRALREVRETHEESKLRWEEANGEAPESSESSSKTEKGRWESLFSLFSGPRNTDIPEGEESMRRKPDSILSFNLNQAGTEYMLCLGKYVGEDYSVTNREISRVRNAKGKLAEPLRNLTCNDDGVGTVGVDLDSFDWESSVGMNGNPEEPLEIPSEDPQFSSLLDAAVATGKSSGKSGKVRRVKQLLRRNGAMVLLVDDFVSDSECDMMVDAATPGLRRSTVNEEGDNQAVSAYRNSQVCYICALDTSTAIKPRLYSTWRNTFSIQRV